MVFAPVAAGKESVLFCKKEPKNFCQFGVRVARPRAL
jgi:hypothetical protein